MSRKSFSSLYISVLGVLAGVASLQAAPAEPGSPHTATSNFQFKHTLAATISNTTVAGGAPRRGNGGDSARFARNSFGADHGLPGNLVGGSFAWPYYNYCIRRPGDHNC